MQMIKTKWDDDWSLYEEEMEEDDQEEYISSSEAKFLKEWQEIVRDSQTNVTLKKALERVKIIHTLSKEHGT
jgi:hypothetical protein